MSKHGVVRHDPDIRTWVNAAQGTDTGESRQGLSLAKHLNYLRAAPTFLQAPEATMILLREAPANS